MILYVINTILFFVLGTMWRKDLWLNFFIKVTLYAVGIANMFMAMQAYGYVVRLPG